MADVNERRKAQNRAAQKKYRTRQKLRIELARAILCNKPHQQQTDTAADRRDWISSVGDCDDTYQPATSRHSNTITSPNSQGSPSPGDTLQSLAVRHLLHTDNGRPSRLLRDSDSLAAALEQYGMPFDLDGGSTDNHTDSADSTTNMGDVSCLDPSLARLDWMHTNGDTSSNGALPSATSPPLSSSDIDKYIMSPVSSLPASSSSISPSSTSTSSTALTLGSVPTRVPDWSSNSSTTSLLKTCCNRPHLEDADDYASCPNSSSSGSSTALVDEISSPLYTAILLGNMDMARLLIRSGAELDLPDRNGDTLLHRCVRRGDITTSSALLDLSANVLNTTVGGRTPLHLAVSTGNEAMVAMLLEWCANGKNPPFEADATATVPTTAATITRTRTASTDQNTATSNVSHRKTGLLGHFIDARDAHNMTALHLAVKLQRIDILKVLLEYGADVNLG